MCSPVAKTVSTVDLDEIVHLLLQLSLLFSSMKFSLVFSQSWRTLTRSSLTLTPCPAQTSTRNSATRTSSSSWRFSREVRSARWLPSSTRLDTSTSSRSSTVRRPYRVYWSYRNVNTESTGVTETLIKNVLLSYQNIHTKSNWVTETFTQSLIELPKHSHKVYWSYRNVNTKFTWVTKTFTQSLVELPKHSHKV